MSKAHLPERAMCPTCGNKYFPDEVPDDCLVICPLAERTPMYQDPYEKDKEDDGLERDQRST